MVYKSYNAETTKNIGIYYGKKATSGDIFCLSGDLGAGKTVFTQGFAIGIGHEGRVTSPTFTLMNVYEGGRFPIYHFDLYRLEDGTNDLESIGYEDFLYSNGVSLVEWPERAEDAFFGNITYIEFKQFESDANYREIKVDENSST